jgi:hypothetical protein
MLTGAAICGQFWKLIIGVTNSLDGNVKVMLKRSYGYRWKAERPCIMNLLVLGLLEDTGGY